MGKIIAFLNFYVKAVLLINLLLYLRPFESIFWPFLEGTFIFKIKKALGTLFLTIVVLFYILLHGMKIQD